MNFNTWNGIFVQTTKDTVSTKNVNKNAYLDNILNVDFLKDDTKYDT